MKEICTELARLAETDKAALAGELKRQFIERYGGDPSGVRLFFSPARINIIGEHIDYNGGKVFPAAIDRALYLAIRKRSDSKIVYDDLRFPGEFSFDINDSFSYKKENDYCNYLNGILKILKDRGYTPDTGFEALFFSSIPAGGGISSSSALECGFAYAICSLYGFDVSRIEIAKIGQQSEHEFMNVKCGIMDQFIIAMGRKDNAMLLDCDTLEYEYVPFDAADYRFVVMNTNKKRQLADSKYNERRSECMQALELIQAEMRAKGKTPIQNLCGLTLEQFNEYKDCLHSPVLEKRARHCVTENARVLQAAQALRANNLDELGKLLEASHVSLRDDYEVTGIELDTLFEQARKIPECKGARMTGAGFGGCAIALVHKDAVDRFIEQVQQAYTQKIGYAASFFACSIGDGTGVLAENA